MFSAGGDGRLFYTEYDEVVAEIMDSIELGEGNKYFSNFLTRYIYLI